MGSSNRSIRRISRLLGASAGAGVLLLSLSVGPVAAQDQHSGGESPNEQPTDPGGGGVAVGGRTVDRGGLPVTGSDVAGLVGLGALAVAAGSSALVVSKRRTRASV